MLCVFSTLHTQKWLFWAACCWRITWKDYIEELSGVKWSCCACDLNWFLRSGKHILPAQTTSCVFHLCSGEELSLGRPGPQGQVDGANPELCAWNQVQPSPRSYVCLPSDLHPTSSNPGSSGLPLLSNIEVFLQQEFCGNKDVCIQLKYWLKRTRSVLHIRFGFMFHFLVYSVHVKTTEWVCRRTRSARFSICLCI